MPCRKYLVQGLVQEVFFRAFAVEAAKRLGIAGCVRNLSDGRVEVVAAGPDVSLAAFRAELEVGPPAASVESIEEFEIEPTETFTSFIIRG